MYVVRINTVVLVAIECSGPTTKSYYIGAQDRCMRAHRRRPVSPVDKFVWLRHMFSSPKIFDHVPSCSMVCAVTGKRHKLTTVARAILLLFVVGNLKINEK